MAEEEEEVVEGPSSSPPLALLRCRPDMTGFCGGGGDLYMHQDSQKNESDDKDNRTNQVKNIKTTDSSLGGKFPHTCRKWGRRIPAPEQSNT